MDVTPYVCLIEILPTVPAVRANPCYPCYPCWRSEDDLNDGA